MNQAPPTGVPADAPAAGYENTAGDALRAAREAAGLSIDTIAQHLKLAPRQVRALEDGDYASLPGRTFVRGFARNYARLLQLDADAVVAALPDATVAPALDQPALGSTARVVGELDERPRRSSRLAWPLLIVALAGLGVAIDINRPDSVLRALIAPYWNEAQRSTETAPAAATPGTATPLPNPLAAPEAAAPPLDPAARETTPTDEANAPSPAGEAAPLPAAGSAATPSATPSPAGSATLVIDYRAPSWTEVRDGNGNRLLVGTMRAGTQETLTGVPPFEVVLGNVSHTTVTWRGSTVDTSAYHKQNVARLRLE